MKKAENGFTTVARHTAVQALVGTCYAENLRIVSAVLEHRRPECACMTRRDGAKPISQLPLEGADLQRLSTSCGSCRQALEDAAVAWESGDSAALRDKLRLYREAHARVRSELLSLAH